VPSVNQRAIGLRKAGIARISSRFGELDLLQFKWSEAALLIALLTAIETHPASGAP
jgi:hypothetical protein